MALRNYNQTSKIQTLWGVQKPELGILFRDCSNLETRAMAQREKAKLTSGTSLQLRYRSSPGAQGPHSSF